MQPATLRMEATLENVYRELLLPGADLLDWVQRNGIYVHLPAMEEVREYLEPLIASSYKRFQEEVQKVWVLSGRFEQTGTYAPEINPGSWQQVSFIIYDVAKMRVPARCPKNTAEPTLLAMPPHPLIDALLEYRGVLKAKGTYHDGWLKRRDPISARVHASFNLQITTTGRLSSSDPNAQNVPRDPRIRKFIQAPKVYVITYANGSELEVPECLMNDGERSNQHLLDRAIKVEVVQKILMEADLKSAEIVVLANLSGDPELCAILNEGRNLHDEVAVQMYGAGYTKAQYIRAKAVNFGVMYGRTAESLVQEFGTDRARDRDGNPIPRAQWLTLGEANKLIAVWDEKFPIAMRFIRSCRAAPGMGLDLLAPTGRRRRFGLVTKDNISALENEAANFPIQGPASDIVLRATYELYRDGIWQERGGKVVNMIHDSSLSEWRSLEDAQAVAPAIAEAYERVGRWICGDLVPFRADFKVGTIWGEEGDLWPKKKKEESLV